MPASALPGGKVMPLWSGRPDLAVPYAHAGSREALLGDAAAVGQRRA